MKENVMLDCPSMLLFLYLFLPFTELFPCTHLRFLHYHLFFLLFFFSFSSYSHALLLLDARYSFLYILISGLVVFLFFDVQFFLILFPLIWFSLILFLLTSSFLLIRFLAHVISPSVSSILLLFFFVSIYSYLYLIFVSLSLYLMPYYLILFRLRALSLIVFVTVHFYFLLYTPSSLLFQFFLYFTVASLSSSSF